MRKRNVVLESIVHFGRVCPGANIAQFEVFLYICENPNMSETEIGRFCGFDRPRISRIVRAMESESAMGALPPFYGLVEMKTKSLDVRSKSINLTPAGKALKKKINSIIKIGICISDDTEMPTDDRQAPAAEIASSLS